MYLEGSPLAGTNIKVLHFTRVTAFQKGANFAGMTELEAIFIKGGKVTADTFTNLSREVNVYFYTMTYDDVVKTAGGEEWFTNADPKVTFYFKDTMPADVEIPEDRDPHYTSDNGFVVVT